ncbi:uncharacterized protein LOC108228799 [Kryptolebias marmoratus]|uniref:uncharacterized protein LOC108228799 n=1 Tax=Kryptolebias marmoratus TaxID=37003 RepID=UPI0007F8661D|nr:uncharacterized protein LOC108228799 [Kryptolebias marmoratus]
MSCLDEEQPSCCSLCQDVLRDLVFTSCGHRFCRQCIASYWDQSAPLGLSFCSQCSDRTRTRSEPQTDEQSSSEQDVGLQEVLDEHQISLRRRCERVTEGSDETGSRTLLNRIYITEGQSEEVNTQHEIWQLETASMTLHETPIRCQDIFKALPEQHGSIRVVLTNGVAGVGKTFSVQKFTLDWAEGSENQDVSVVVLLSFRELNLVRDEQHSLLTLLHVFHPTLQKLPAEKLAVCKLLFIFDGLDESRLSLDFTNRQLLSDVTQKSSVNVLLTNLIKGNLLPSALVWITSRPAAANQIPPSCVDRLYQEDLELCGLDVTEASVYSGVCTEIFRRECVIFQKPVYCFVHLSVQEFLAAVYMFHCFTSRNMEVMEDFLGTDWKSTCCNLFMCEFMEESWYDNVFDDDDEEEDEKENKKEGEEKVEEEEKENGSLINKSEHDPYLSLDFFLGRVMKKSIESKTGHLDLFVWFLHGLCLNQKLFPGQSSTETTQRIIYNLKNMISYNMFPETNTNIFHCLLEMKDLSVHQEIQEFLKSENRSEKELSEIHCLALAYMLQVSEEVLDELDLNRYKISRHGQARLILAVRNCRRFRLCGFSLPETYCKVLSSALKSNPSHLTELELSSDDLQGSGMKHLADGLRSPNCKLQKLWLKCCSLSEISCVSLGSALMSNSSHLTELDLSFNKLQDSGLKQLCGFLKSPDCRLETLRLMECSLSEAGCASLGLSLQSNPSHLTELDLSQNVLLEDLGVQQLKTFLESPDQRLQTLRLRNCRLDTFRFVQAFFLSNMSHLRELDLSFNAPNDSAVEWLCNFLESPNCGLEKLGLEGCGLSEVSCACLVSCLQSDLIHLKHLDLRNNNLQDLHVSQLYDLLESPSHSLDTLRCL